MDGGRRKPDDSSGQKSETCDYEQQPRKEIKIKILLLGIALFVSGSMIQSPLSQQNAYADGLFQENLPPAKLGDRQASLFVKINPPILTSDTQQDAFLQFRLFDSRNNDTIKFTTFIISVTKGTDPKAQPLLTDAFLTDTGLLTIKIQPQQGPVSIAATQDQYLNAWKADPGGTVNVKGPILLEGGLYHFRIELLTVDNVRNLFAPGDSPVFNTYLSVGDVSSQNIQFEGKTYPATVISYYDKVQDFTFDASTKTASWAMPFDWNVSRIQNAPNVFVHEEVKVPKSFSGVGDASAFDAKVNGKPIAGRMLAVDPFTDENNLILHFLINKNDILDMARNVSPSNETMSFSFSPAGAGTGEQTSGEISTDTGGVHVLLDWKPAQLKSGSDTSLHLQFVDAFAGTNITTDDVKYDLKIFDKGGKEILVKTDQTAKGGTAEQTGLDFPADDTYRVEVTVKALLKEGQSPDLTRNGVARGVVVVPEFPASLATFLALGTAIGTIVAIRRLLAWKHKS
jgi:hypothetical protein